MSFYDTSNDQEFNKVKLPVNAASLLVTGGRHVNTLYSSSPKLLPIVCNGREIQSIA